MSNYRQIFYQIVFGTKHRKPTIDEAYCKELYQYISGVIKNKNCKLYRINGMEDHIHIFSDLHPTVSLSDYIKDIKVASNGWMKANGNFSKSEAWQEARLNDEVGQGYGAFTYSIREKDMIINYVKNQKEHHRTETFYDEFKRLLIARLNESFGQENGIEFDEKYLL